MATLVPAMRGRSGEWLDSILADLAAGRTVQFSTCTRTVVYGPKLVAKLRAAGVEPFKLDKGGALVAYAGTSKGQPRYDCIGLANGRLLVGLVSYA